MTHGMQMHVTRALAPALVLLLGGATAGAQEGAPGSALGRRIAAAPDGDVRIEFAAREDACGGGRNMVRLGRMFHGSTVEGFGTFSDARCDAGNAQVTLVRREGKVLEVRTSIGARWSNDVGGTSLGQVSAPEAAAYFLALADAEESRAGRGALWAAAIADSAEPARQFLAFAMNEGRPWKHRHTALLLAGATGDAAIATELERIARSGPTGTSDGTERRKKNEGNLAGTAAQALATMPDDLGTAALVRLATEAPNEDVRKTAIFHAAQSGDPRGVRIARTIAEDTRQSDEVRHMAIFGLLNSDDTGRDEREWARALFPRLTSRKLRDPILMGLAQHGSEADRRWVLALAADGNLPTETRKSAVFWAGQGGTPIADLVATYRKVRDREVKDHVIFALSQRREEAATDALVSIVKSDDDREMRKKALFWLGQRKDEKAAKVLTDLINQ